SPFLSRPAPPGRWTWRWASAAKVPSCSEHMAPAWIAMLRRASCVAWPAGRASPSGWAPTRCVTPSSPRPSTPACLCATCRRRPATPTRARPCAMTEVGCPSIATPRTSWPHSWPARPADLGPHRQPALAVGLAGQFLDARVPRVLDHPGTPDLARLEVENAGVGAERFAQYLRELLDVDGHRREPIQCSAHRHVEFGGQLVVAAVASGVQRRAATLGELEGPGSLTTQRNHERGAGGLEALVWKFGAEHADDRGAVRAVGG